jgi:hypothetical protein
MDEYESMTTQELFDVLRNLGERPVMRSQRLLAKQVGRIIKNRQTPCANASAKNKKQEEEKEGG